MMDIPTIDLIDHLDEDGVIGTVEPFGTNNTRKVAVQTSKLLEWAAFVHSKSNCRWVEVAVTPLSPMAAYPEDGSSKGIAISPGLYTEEYAEVLD